MEKVTVLYLLKEILIFYSADIHSPRNENIGKLTFVFLKNFEAAGIVKLFICVGVMIFATSESPAVKLEIPK